MLLWQRLRIAFACEYKHKYLEDSSVPCQFNKMILVGSPLEPDTSSDRNFWLELRYQVCICFCRTSLNANERVVGYPHNSVATFQCMAPSYLAHWYCWGGGVHRWLKPLIDFSLSETCKTSFNTKLSLGKVPSSISAPFLYILQWRYILSSAVGLINYVLACKQGEW